MDKHVYVINLSFVGDQENILLMRLTIKRSITGPSLLTASQRE